MTMTSVELLSATLAGRTPRRVVGKRAKRGEGKQTLTSVANHEVARKRLDLIVVSNEARADGREAAPMAVCKRLSNGAKLAATHQRAQIELRASHCLSPNCPIARARVACHAIVTKRQRHAPLAIIRRHVCDVTARNRMLAIGDANQRQA